MKIYLLLILNYSLLTFSSFAQNKFSSDYEFGISLNSTGYEKLKKELEESESLSNQINTIICNYKTLQKDSIKIFDFINATKEKILNNKIKVYQYGSDISLELIQKEEVPLYFFRCDTEFIENENGDLFPLPIRDTVNYNESKRLDITQEWFYNYKTNKLQVQNICYSFAVAKYDELNNYRGLMPMFVIKNNEFSSINNQKNITKDKNIVWAQRIKLGIPLTEFLRPGTSRQKPQPIKSINNSELGKTLFSQVVNGKLKAYKPDSDDVYTKSELDSLIKSRNYTEYIEHDSGDLVPIKITKPYTYEEVNRINVKQELTFDPVSLKIESKIKSVMILIEIWDSSGKFKDYKNLFEIRF
tara:strand:+ start:601 stop:1671 length:1071 start_codon:yes stop_codon:yes gene_type:complete